MIDKEKKIKIIIACHKKCATPLDPAYMPVQVGASVTAGNWTSAG